MSFNDPIADLLTRIRNAKLAKHRFVDFPLSQMNLGIIKVMQTHGFVEKLLVNDEKKLARVFLRYTDGRKCVINDLKRVSKPGLRRYTGYKEMPSILGGLGIAIVSTSKGIMDDATARKAKVGGEILCFVW